MSQRVDFDTSDEQYERYADRLAREPRCEECDFVSVEALVKHEPCGALLCVECYQACLCGETDSTHAEVKS